jgi:hypothetical protein
MFSQSRYQACHFTCRTNLPFRITHTEIHSTDKHSRSLYVLFEACSLWRDLWVLYATDTLPQPSRTHDLNLAYRTLRKYSHTQAVLQGNYKTSTQGTLYLHKRTFKTGLTSKKKTVFTNDVVGWGVRVGVGGASGTAVPGDRVQGATESKGRQEPDNINFDNGCDFF